jgi:hypothetical protein
MKAWRIHAAMLAGLVAMVLLLTYPLVYHLTTAIAGPPGDNYDFLWRQEWFARALFDRRLSPFHTDTFYYPFGYDLALGPMSLAQVFLSLPLTMVAGHTLSYNAVSLLSFVMAGFGAYLLVLWLTRSPIAGMVGGVIFAFCPARVSALTAGWFNVLGTMWLPYAALCLELMLDKRHVRWGIAAAAFCTLILFSDWYNLPMLGAVVAVYLLYRLRPWSMHIRSRALRRTLVAFLGIVVLSAVASLGLTRPLWQEAMRLPAYSMPYLDSIAPSLDYFLVPYAERTLLGGTPIPYDAYLASLPVYVGVLTLALAAVGYRTRQDRATRSFAWMAVVALVLALGPRLRWSGEPVIIPVPDQVEKVFTAGMRLLATRLALTPMPSYYALRAPNTIYVPLPALLLQLFVPLLSRMRFWSRLSFVLCLALAVLAGIGVASLLARVEHCSNSWCSARRSHGDAAKWALGSTIAVFLFLEFAALPYRMGYSEARPRPVDEWLAQQEGDFAIAEFPYEKQLTAAYLFYCTVFHGKKLCSGSQPFAPEGHRLARALLYAFPSEATVELLRTWGPKYVLVGSREYGSQWDQVQRGIAAYSDLRLVAVFDDTPVYHETGLWNWIPGYDRRLAADRTYVYELSARQLDN